MMLVRLLLVITLTMPGPLYAFSMTIPVIDISSEEKEAGVALGMLIENHPKKEVRTYFEKWIAEASVKFISRAEIMPSTMRVENISLVNEGNVLAFIYNPRFLISYLDPDPNIDRKLKFLALYHEFIVIRNHFNGTELLRSGTFAPGETPEDRVRHVWRVHEPAFKAVWDLAKEMGVTNLLFSDVEDTIKHFGERRAVLDGFYKRLSNPVIVGGGITVKEYRALVREVYEERLKNLEQDI